MHGTPEKNETIMIECQTQNTTVRVFRIKRFLFTTYRIEIDTIDMMDLVWMDLSYTQMCAFVTLLTDVRAMVKTSCKSKNGECKSSD